MVKLLLYRFWGGFFWCFFGWVFCLVVLFVSLFLPISFTEAPSDCKWMGSFVRSYSFTSHLWHFSLEFSPSYKSPFRKHLSFICFEYIKIMMSTVLSKSMETVKLKRVNRGQILGLLPCHKQILKYSFFFYFIGFFHRNEKHDFCFQTLLEFFHY